jgi:hypothetical protein
VVSIPLIFAQSNDNTNIPIFSPYETEHNFGTISENEGYAEHFFKFKNTGTAPLSITQVQVSCGCTRPEWPKDPILPGQEGLIIITFNPKGQSKGTFIKPSYVYTNEDGGFKRHRLSLTGVIVDKPSDPKVTFTDTIGGMGIDRKNMDFRTLNTAMQYSDRVYIKNYNPETVYFSWDNVPDYMIIKAPDSLKADWPGDITVTINGSKIATKRGRITDKITWTIKDRTGQVLGSEQLSATVNYVDDFSKLSALQTVSAPELVIASTILDFGSVKKSALGFIGGIANKPLTLTNKGKSDLLIHSISGEDERLHLPDLNGKTIKAGETITLQATVKEKDLRLKELDTEIYVVCNDPKGPVRRIRVTAQKAN